jgi:hypothetical protein
MADDDRLEEFTEALAWIDAANRLLCANDCPLDVASHLDFAARSLAAHVSALGGSTPDRGADSEHWLN